MKAHGLGELVNMNYIPQTEEEAAGFDRKQNWMFAVLFDRVQTPTGRTILAPCKDHSDAWKVLHMLAQDGTTSIAAKIEERDRRTALQNLRLGDSWKGTQHEFLQHFLALVNYVTALNQDPEFALSQAQLKEYLGQLSILPRTSVTSNCMRWKQSSATDKPLSLMTNTSFA